MPQIEICSRMEMGSRQENHKLRTNTTAKIFCTCIHCSREAAAANGGTSTRPGGVAEHSQHGDGGLMRWLKQTSGAGQAARAPWALSGDLGSTVQGEYSSVLLGPRRYWWRAKEIGPSSASSGDWTVKLVGSPRLIPSCAVHAFVPLPASNVSQSRRRLTQYC